jgi:hypothetical protein
MECENYTSLFCYILLVENDILLLLLIKYTIFLLMRDKEVCFSSLFDLKSKYMFNDI